MIALLLILLSASAVFVMLAISILTWEKTSFVERAFLIIVTIVLWSWLMKQILKWGIEKC